MAMLAFASCDGYGKVFTESYPNSITTRNTWDPKGFLEKISLGSNNFVLWQYVSEDKPGRINQYKRGSDLMTTLSYDNNNFPKSFNYDNLDRLD